MTTLTRFIHISDTHFGPEKEYSYYEKNPYNDALKLVETINNLPFAPDFIIHTGDVVSYQDPKAYQCAKEVLSKIKYPIYFATGNHDDPIQLNSFSIFGKKTDLLEDDNFVSYYFEVNDTVFITFDAKHTDNNNPSGFIQSAQFNALREFIDNCSKNFILFNHFPPLSIDAPWMDNNLIISNGNDLHNYLVTRQNKCLGVFFGHIHQPLQIHQQGILYTSCPSNTFQFGGWPTDENILSYNPNGVAGMNLVTVDGDKIIAKFIKRDSS